MSSKEVSDGERISICNTQVHVDCNTDTDTHAQTHTHQRQTHSVTSTHTSTHTLTHTCCDIAIVPHCHKHCRQSLPHADCCTVPNSCTAMPPHCPTFTHTPPHTLQHRHTHHCKTATNTHAHTLRLPQSSSFSLHISLSETLPRTLTLYSLTHAHALPHYDTATHTVTLPHYHPPTHTVAPPQTHIHCDCLCNTHAHPLP
jgi:predicted component of type VI protein secretion system